MALFREEKGERTASTVSGSFQVLNDFAKKRQRGKDSNLFSGMEVRQTEC
jgi:hypothetical protein